jgi:hypothetical protein
MHGITRLVAHFARLNTRCKIGQIIKVRQYSPGLLRFNGNQKAHMNKNALAIILDLDIDLMILTIIRLIDLDRACAFINP